MINRRCGYSIAEVLVGLVIMLVVSLGAGAITKSVLMTSRKSKTVILGMSLETNFLDAVNNRNQAGYSAPNILTFLKSGQPVQSIPIHSQLGSPTTPEVVYNLNLHPLAPEEMYFDTGGKIVTSGESWVLKFVAAYKKLPTPVDQFQQYAVAYEISSNPSVFSLQSFGSKSDPSAFLDKDFVFPLSQTLFAADPTGLAGSIGTCSTPINQVISLYSINLESGKTNCVIKGDECGKDEISVGIGAAINLNGDYAINLKCIPIHKCSCTHINPKDWVATSLSPQELFRGVAGAKCGTCEYVYKKEVKAQVPASGNNVVADVLALPVCPKEKYDVNQIQCSASMVSISKASINPPCDVSIAPVTTTTTFLAPPNTTSNTATCDVTGWDHQSLDGCYTWAYQMSVDSAVCNLRSPESDVKDAYAEK